MRRSLTILAITWCLILASGQRLLVDDAGYELSRLVVRGLVAVREVMSIFPGDKNQKGIASATATKLHLLVTLREGIASVTEGRESWTRLGKTRVDFQPVADLNVMVFDTVRAAQAGIFEMFSTDNYACRR